MLKILPILLCCTALIDAQYLPIILKLCSIFYPIMLNILPSVSMLCYQICNPWVNSNYLKHRL